jgi:hypothetical protein
MVLPDGEMHVAADGALRGGEVSCHQLQQGGLASAIGAHQRNTRVAVHTKVKVLVKIILLGNNNIQNVSVLLCQPPLPSAEVITLVHSGLKKESWACVSVQ